MKAKTMLSTIDYARKKKRRGQDWDSVTDEEIFELPETEVNHTERKGAQWIKESISEERRSRLRTPSAFEVEMIPLDEDWEPDGTPQPAMILNYSEEGVCLEHVELIPQPYVSINWHDSHNRQHTAIVHLKWCRSTEDQKILTGGRVCSMKTF